jgi:hypothetical protein
MRYRATNTSKELMTNEEAWDITNRLVEALKHPLYFAQALYQLGTPADAECLEVIIGTTNHLRSEGMSELEERTHHYMKSTAQSLRGRGIH